MSEFPGLSPGFNLPWGAKNDSRAPWNADEIEVDFEEVVGYLIDREGDVAGYVAFEGAEADEDAWFVELPYQDDPAGPFESYEGALSYILAEAGSDIEDEVAAREAELRREDPFGYDDPRI